MKHTASSHTAPATRRRKSIAVAAIPMGQSLAEISRAAETERRIQVEHAEAEALRRKFDEAAGESARYGYG